MIALSSPRIIWSQVGLLDKSKVPSAGQGHRPLLNQAMDKVAFLPFGLLVDRWRWGVFNGEITPGQLQQAWNDLRRQYQGITPPVERTEANFDPGANSTFRQHALHPLLPRPILQFQFYKAACDQAGWKGPLHRCSFYGNKEVGRRLNAMLEMGASRPWPDALEAFTGSREMSGEAMIEYFRR
jgi:peptidyl-dipeptidase A